MKWMRGLAIFLAAAALGGCAAAPRGPGVMVLPGPGKPFEVFQSDDRACRQWAGQQAAAASRDAAREDLARGAAIGTIVGAGLGAAVGSASGHAGAGAILGAAGGLLGGTAVASGPAHAAAWENQRRYDIAYQQCMYARGNQIPGAPRPARRAYSIPPPPPPPGFTSGAPVYPPPPPVQ